jgi:hypothetical protein
MESVEVLPALAVVHARQSCLVLWQELSWPDNVYTAGDAGVDCYHAAVLRQWFHWAFLVAELRTLWLDMPGMCTYGHGKCSK